MQDLKYVTSKAWLLRKPLENVLHKNKGINFKKRERERNTMMEIVFIKTDLQDHTRAVHLKVDQSDWSTSKFTGTFPYS